MLREENGSTKYARNERGQEEVTTELSFFALEGESNGERGVSVQYTAAVEVHTPWDRRYVFLA
jgi:hypothetical protein